MIRPLLKYAMVLGVVAALEGCASQPGVGAASAARDRLALSAELLDLADYGASRFQEVFVDCVVRKIEPRKLAVIAMIRNEAVANMRSIALGNEPGRDLVDFYVWSHVARQACANRVRLLPDLAPDTCGDTYEKIAQRVDAMAHRWISADRLQRIDTAVAAYLSRHPDVITAALFRMVDMKDRQGPGRPEEDLSSDEGMFSPVSEAARELEQTRITGQQMIWMLSRMPTAVGWEAQAQVDLALTSPELERLRGRFETLHGSVDGLSVSVQSLDAGLGEKGGLRAVVREAILMGSAALLGLVVAGTACALLVVWAVRRPRRPR